MAKGRFLGLCFLFSVLGHLFCLGVFQIVVMPSKFEGESFPRVSFLGPILEEITFQSEVSAAEGIFPKRYLLKGGDELALNLGAIPRQSAPAKEKIIPLRRRAFSPPAEKRIVSRSVPRRDDFPGLRRHLIYKPDLPSWPHEEVTGEVGLRFLVNPEGRVEMTEIKQTSSYPELDLFAKRYLKSWIFAALPVETSQQWDEIKLKLCLPAPGGE